VLEVGKDRRGSGMVDWRTVMKSLGSDILLV
jgi:hypothetical protein